jgi:hypothetical protein
MRSCIFPNAATSQSFAPLCATMTSVSKYEQEKGIIFPDAYKDFYERCALSVPANLVGTDLINDKPELKKWAIELLQENGVNDILDEKDFVFMMHQGYIFWFFRADGIQNPDVFGYSEIDKQIKNLGYLEDFLRQYS